MNNAKINILYADTDSHACKAFEENFRHRYDIFIASSVEESIAVLASWEIHLTIADRHLPSKNGAGLLDIIAEKYPDIIRMLLTTHPDIETAIDAVNRLRIFAYILKPWKTEVLQQTIDSCHRNHELNHERKKQLAKLMRTNEQLEFMLRDKLIS